MQKRIAASLSVTLILFVIPVRASVLSATAADGVSDPPGGQTVNSSTSPVVTVGPLRVADNNTGQGAGFSSGNVFGALAVASHACVEPSAMFGQESSADGSGSVTYSDAFKIQSSTLPAGTTVSLEFCVIAGFNKQIGDSISPLLTTQTLNTAQATFGVGVDTSGSTTGLYSFSDSSR